MGSRIAARARRANGTRGGRPVTGSPVWRKDPGTGQSQWFARVTLPTGVRLPVKLDPRVSRDDGARARDLARQVAELARDGKFTAGPETVAEYAERHIADLHARYPTSRLPDDRRSRLHRVLRLLHGIPIAKVTREQIEDIVTALDRETRDGALSWKTAQEIWSATRCLFRSAARSKNRALRARADDPTEGVEPPDRGTRKGKQYLYPSEVLQLLECEDVPLTWRRAAALCVYLYLRPGELDALTWDDVDLEHGIVHVHQATCGRTGRLKDVKTGEARRVPIESELVPMLAAMHSESGGQGNVAPLRGINDNLARTLRHFLRVAGARREELFVQGDRTRKAITFYDLRATGITWMALRGDNPMAIKQRAGHRRFETTEGYIREAENLRSASAGEPFPPLPQVLVGSGPVLAKGSFPGPAKPKTSAWIAERAGVEPAAGFWPAPA